MITEEDHKPNRSKQEYMFTVVISYTGPVPHQIGRILSKENTKVYHSISNKLFQRLFTHKDKTENQHPGVYCIPCECGLGDTPETGRTITPRKTEHYTCCVKGQTEKSSVAKHTWETGHIEWNGKKPLILSNPKDYFSTRIRESIEIFKHATIPQEGQPLNDAWTDLFSLLYPINNSLVHISFSIHISIHISNH